jgi:hypothetical protein
MAKRLDALSKPVKWIWANTEPLSKWIQILALIVAAYWAYVRFSLGEKPALETRVSVTSHLSVEPGPVPDTCYVFLDYSLSNQGIAPFDIRSVHIRAWRSELPQLAPKMPQFIDTKELEHGQQVIDSSSSELLNMHFAQGESCGRTFSWIFPKQKPAFHIFQVDVEASNGNDIKHISTQTWSQDVCTSAFRRSNASDNKPDSNN